jgi:hypothetical protein
MMIGGPFDNGIIHVDKSEEVWYQAGDLMDFDNGQRVETYVRDMFVSGDNEPQFYFRWVEMCRINAAKIYMRRMGMSLYSIYNKVEWGTWES